MAITLIRIDDRMIHGQTITRWSKEYPCTGLIVVNDAISKDPLLSSALKGTSDKKTFVWTVEHFVNVYEKVLNSEDQYFLITKTAKDMAKLLLDYGLDIPLNKVTVGPLSSRKETKNIGNNQDVSFEEAENFERMSKAGFDIEFGLVKEQTIGNWSKFRKMFL